MYNKKTTYIHNLKNYLKSIYNLKKNYLKSIYNLENYLK